MIPWFVLKAFGIDESFITCLAIGSTIQLVGTAVPLPGGTGGAEGGFVMFYKNMFGPATSAGFLVWRIVTFFAPTIIAAPLLGLSTRNRTVSIYRRVQRIKRRLSGSGKGHSGHRGHGGGVKLSGKTVDEKAAKHE